MSNELTAELAKALGLPRDVRKAVLTLEATNVPRLDLECFWRASDGQLVLQRTGVDVAELRRIRFSYRLVRPGQP